MKYLGVMLLLIGCVSAPTRTHTYNCMIFNSNTNYELQWLGQYEKWEDAKSDAWKVTKELIDQNTISKDSYPQCYMRDDNKWFVIRGNK